MPVVVALPKGGVPVAVEIAGQLGAQLDVLVVRKIGHPRQRELGLGALAEGGIAVLPETDRIRAIDRAELDAVIAAEHAEMRRRVDRYRAGRPSVAVAGRPVILVDDGLATGVTARAAIESLHRANAAAITLAVPVGAPEAITALMPLVDEVLCLLAPSNFEAVGTWYQDFRQLTDDAVVLALAESDDPWENRGSG